MTFTEMLGLLLADDAKWVATRNDLPSPFTRGFIFVDVDVDVDIETSSLQLYCTTQASKHIIMEVYQFSYADIIARNWVCYKMDSPDFLLPIVVTQDG